MEIAALQGQIKTDFPLKVDGIKISSRSLRVIYRAMVYSVTTLFKAIATVVKNIATFQAASASLLLYNAS